jgi:hypothetical protein
MVIGSFWAIYFALLLRGDADRSWLFHLHGAVFLGWMGVRACVGDESRTVADDRPGAAGAQVEWPPCTT